MASIKQEFRRKLDEKRLQKDFLRNMRFKRSLSRLKYFLSVGAHDSIISNEWLVLKTFLKSDDIRA